MERFWEKVDRAGGADACWLWQAKRNSNGYGAFSVGSRTDGTRRMVLAHRFAYELVRGAIPDGLTIDHLCRNRACVNPAHLEVVPIRINILRAPSALATVNAAKTVCPRGHSYDENNTGGSGTGVRWCRTCKRQKNRERRTSVRAA